MQKRGTIAIATKRCRERSSNNNSRYAVAAAASLLVYAVAVAASGGWSFVFGERDRSIHPSINRSRGW
jgi:hypothetical protein